MTLAGTISGNESHAANESHGAAGWLPLSDACRKLAMSKERLMRRVLMGQIRGELHLGRWLISIESLDAFIRAHEGGHSAA